MKTTRILCILPHSVDTRVSLRIQMLQQAGFQVKAVAFETVYHPGQFPACPVQSLGRLSFKNYLFRVPEILTRVFRIRSEIRRNDIVYAFYLEMALAALVAGLGLAKPVILEIHDIKWPQVARGPIGRLVRFADRLITGACNFLVLTSSGYHVYYRAYLNVRIPSLVVENKVEASFAAAIQKKGVSAPNGRPLEDRPLRIGYFGILKDEWGFRVLELLTASAPDKFEVVLAGTSNKIENFLQRVAQNSSMEYSGPYQEPDDLASLYGEVDVVMACYATTVPGCWAQSNRYYYACLFRRPLIVRAGTGDARQVERHQVGLIVTDDDVEDAVNSICRITIEDWLRWHANMATLPPEAYVHNDDAARLRRVLCTL